MFAQIFDTAKRILSRSPSYQGRSSEARDTSTVPSDPDIAMVTTRGGIETPGSIATPVSSSKKRAAKRELDSLETPTQAKRQRKTASTPRKELVEETPQPDEPVPESNEDSSDTITIVVPESAASAAEDPLPIRHRSSPRVVVAKLSPPYRDNDDDVVPTQESDYHTPDGEPGSVYATPATRKQQAGSPTPKAKQVKSETPGTAKRARGRPKKAQKEDSSTLEITQTTVKILDDEIPSSTYESEAAVVSSQHAPATVPPPKQAHTRFGSEEPKPEPTQNAVVVNAQGHKRFEFESPATTRSARQVEPHHDDNDNDSSASDSDEAPEIVTTAAATTAAQASLADASRARLAQEAKTLAKRQARADLLAAQQAAKRKRDEKKARKLAKQAAKEKSLVAATEDNNNDHNNNDDDDDDNPEHNDDEDAHHTAAPSSLLPASLLSALPAIRPSTPPLARNGKTQEAQHREKLAHHIKFLERAEKPAKDVQRGNVSVAVWQRRSAVLAPVGRKATKGVREGWLGGRETAKKSGKGRRVGKGKGRVERRGVVGGVKGFLRGED
ncbi:hypothetical protein ACN47E_007290 [Coniothyrium glycines]